MANDGGQREEYSAAEVFYANQALYTVQAEDYDKRNHAKNPILIDYYRRVLLRDVMEEARVARLSCLDVGCGTGFLEAVLGGTFDRHVGVDGTRALLSIARRKFAAPLEFMQANAARLPFGDETMDLVCSNALLHHIPDYEKVLQEMVRCLKPGGRLFLGYEPNAIPYRLLKPVLMILAKLVPEQRRSDEIHRKIRDQGYTDLAGADFHKLSEYHIFHGKGIHPFALRRQLETWGIEASEIHFTSLYQALLLRDSGLPLPVERLPYWVHSLSGRFSLSFTLTGVRAFR